MRKSISWKAHWLVLVLALLAAALTSCVVNPVPTPSSEGALSADTGNASADALSDTPTAPGGDAQGADLAGTESDASGTDTADADGADGDGGGTDAGDSVNTTDAIDSSDTPDGIDTIDSVDSSDTSDAIECCPLDPPGCDCVHTGGTKGPGGCMTICDSAPVGWKQAVDSNGCPYWQTGPQSCMMAPIKCGENPPMFPTYTNFCETDDDCDYVIHQTDCCGNATAMGVWKLVKSNFESAETQCKSQYPDCGCPAMPPQAQDGNTSATGSFTVTCNSGQCKTKVAK